MAHDDHYPKDCWSRTPYYRPGGKLSAEQLNASQANAVRRDRLINVAMHGVGVVFGYQITTDENGHVVISDGCIEVSCGLAFDKYGRMLFWRGGWISMHDIIGHKPDCEGNFMLRVHYAEKSDRGDAFDPCHEGSDWVDHCVAFTLKHDCEPFDHCAPDVPTDACMTRKEWVCVRNGFHPGVVPMDEELACACGDIPDLSSSDCGRVAYDPEAGLPLSCVKICDLDKEKLSCDPRFDFCPCTKVESCQIRPVAYRNPLLHELINQDDVPLAKIKSYSWSDWEMEAWSDQYRVPFAAFKRRSMICRKGHSPSAKDGYYVMFDRPVQRRTLHPLSVIMEIFIRVNRPHYWEPWRIPVDVLGLDKNGGVIPEDSDEDCAWGVLICPDQKWIDDELEDEDSTILDCANKGQLARVEISLRGQIIRDKCGLMIDARPPDVDKDDPCGNRAGQERPGDTWISVFRVGPDAPPDGGYKNPDTYDDKPKNKR